MNKNQTIDLDNQSLLMASTMPITDQQNKTQLWITEDYGDLLAFKQSRELAQYLASNQHLVYQVNRFQTDITVSAKMPYRVLLERLSSGSVATEWDLSAVPYELNLCPWLDILMRAYAKLQKGYFLRLLEQVGLSQLEYTAIILNAFIGWIRRLAKSKVFRTLRRNAIRKEEANRASIKEYLDALWERHADMLFIRVDLEYQKDKPTTVEQALTHRDAFIERLDKHPKLRNRLGYILKLEYGLRRGLHFHALLVFNGQTFKDDIGLGKTTGELWEQVTGGTRNYWNCNANKKSYAANGKLGIGRIKYHDLELRTNLENDVLLYFSKLDALRSLRCGRRTLNKGERPMFQKCKRGKFRKYMIPSKWQVQKQVTG